MNIAHAGGSIWLSHWLLNVFSTKSPNKQLNTANITPINGFPDKIVALAATNVIWCVAGVADPVWANINDKALIPKHKVGNTDNISDATPVLLNDIATYDTKIPIEAPNITLYPKALPVEKKCLPHFLHPLHNLPSSFTHFPINPLLPIISLAIIPDVATVKQLSLL